jgi:hypothetical protein
VLELGRQRRVAEDLLASPALSSFFWPAWPSMNALPVFARLAASLSWPSCETPAAASLGASHFGPLPVVVVLPLLAFESAMTFWRCLGGHLRPLAVRDAVLVGGGIVPGLLVGVGLGVGGRLVRRRLLAGLDLARARVAPASCSRDVGAQRLAREDQLGLVGALAGAVGDVVGAALLGGRGWSSRFSRMRPSCIAAPASFCCGPTTRAIESA